MRAFFVLAVVVTLCAVFTTATVTATATATATAMTPAHDLVIQQVQQGLNLAWEAQFQKFNNLALKLQVVSPSCEALFQSFLAAQQACANVTSLLSGNISNSDVAAFCSSTCVTQMRSILTSIPSKCTIADVDEIAISQGGEAGEAVEVINGLLNIINLPCLQHQGQYCLPQVFAARTIFQHPPPFSNQELTQVCHPCLGMYMKVIAEIDQEELLDPEDTTLSYLSVLCLTHNNTFCFSEFYNAALAIQARVQQGQTGIPDATLLGSLCSPCVTRAFSRLAILTNNTMYRELVSQLNFACIRNNAGNVCWPLVAEAAYNLTSCQAQFLSIPPSCNATCAGYLDTLLSQGGCCANIVIALAIKEANLPISPAALASSLRAMCGVTSTLQPACPVASFLFRLALRNLRYEYYQNHAEQVRQRIIEDVAAQAGVDPSSVTVDSVSSAAVGVQVSVSIVTPSQEDAIDTQASMTAAVEDGTFAFPSLASLPLESRVNPISGPDEEPSTSIASAVAPQALFLLVLLLSLLAL